MTGSRYACSCQDYLQRDYYYVSNLLSARKGEKFPRSSPSILKPGRYEEMQLMMDGVAQGLDDAAMTPANVNRRMYIVTPSGNVSGEMMVPGESTINVTYPSGNRDFPGVFRDFGRQYTRQQGKNPDAKSETYPKMMDYDSIPGTNGQPRTITGITDFWEPTLDEARFCKHIYAMKYMSKIYPPEPSDYPVEAGSIAEWEAQLVLKTQKDQEKAGYKLLRYGLGLMDVPPYNLQSPMMGPVLTKLLNLPSNFINISGFIMYDKNGRAYKVADGEKPNSDGG